jgi:hypothetical protein
MSIEQCECGQMYFAGASPICWECTVASGGPDWSDDGQPGNNNALKDKKRLTACQIVDKLLTDEAKHESKKRRGRPKKAL